MAELTPSQILWRERVESLIALAAPALDLLLAVGDRVSRIAEPEDPGHYPVQSGSDTSLPAEFEASRADSEPTDVGA